MKLTTILIAGAAMFAATGAQAQTAGTYDFSYLFGSTGNTVSGVLTGSLEADKNIFDITGVQSYSVNGEAAMDMPTAGSLDQYYKYANDPATASLDGSKLNFYLLNNTKSQILVAGVNDATSAAFDANVIGATPNYGGSGSVETFDAANFMASFAPTVTTGAGAGAVPEPAAWMMMIVGMGAVGYAMRRQKAVSRVQFA